LRQRNPPASIPYKQWFDGLPSQAAAKVTVAKDGDTLIVLFGGGTKRGQQRDIDKAKELLAEYKARKKAMTSKTSSKHKG
jgi:hypothetical protein